MDYRLLSKQMQRNVTDFYDEHKNKQLPYHNITHTKDVVKAAKKIGNHYQLNEHECFIVTTAAWFHDVGYYYKDVINHEEKGMEMATRFLSDSHLDKATITAVNNCILATKMPQSPATLLEQIICDADLFHLGTDDFKAQNKLIHTELEKTSNNVINKKEWRKSAISFLQAHRFQTGYAASLLNKKKQENLEKLLRKDKEDPNNNLPVVLHQKRIPTEEANEEKPLQEPEKPSKGIETMFRIAASNHQRLSDMADQKAHIMISVNSIIISVVIGLVVRKLETAHNLILPTFILLSGSVIVVIFAILATRPKISAGLFTPDQLQAKSVNLLFFGNFYKMGYEPYYDGMKKIMADRDFLYASLIRDLHSQGVVLGHKYKLLRISYTVFMFALIVSIIAFAVVIVFYS